MGFEFQNLYKRGKGAWAIKFFKERILTALVEDLEAKESRGIKNSVCDLIKASLRDTVEVSKEIEDGGYFKVHFHEKIKVFLDMYAEWNNAKTKRDRVVLLARLREYKVAIFDDLKKHMHQLEESGEFDLRVAEYRKILFIKRDQNVALGRVFQPLIEKHADMFPNLRHALNTFFKRNNDAENGQGEYAD